MRDANFEFDRELLPDSIERSWSQLMMLFQVCFTDAVCLRQGGFFLRFLSEDSEPETEFFGGAAAGTENSSSATSSAVQFEFKRDTDPKSYRIRSRDFKNGPHPEPCFL